MTLAGTLAMAMAVALAGITPAAGAEGTAEVRAQEPTHSPETGVVSSRPDFTGTWILDRKNSDDPSKLRPGGGRGFAGGQARPGGPGGRGGGFGRGGPGGGGGFRGGDPSGGPPRGDMEGGEEGNAPRRRMNPQPEKLILDQRDGALDLYDEARLVRTFAWATPPDTAQVARATWRGAKLVGEVRTPLGVPGSQTFELGPDGKALTVVTRMERRDGEAVELTSRYAKYEGD